MAGAEELSDIETGAALVEVTRYCIPQGPGPPQRPHIGAAGASDAADDLAPSAPTANKLSARAVLPDPHLGQVNFSSPPLMLRTNCSNFVWQSRQLYSYIGKKPPEVFNLISDL
jgi:hypothetical protein